MTMTPFQINMARGLVLPVAVRKRWHRWLVVYVFVSAIVCGTAFRRAVVHVETLKGEQARLDLEEQRFRAQRSGVRDLREYAGALSVRLAGCVDRMEAIDRFQTTGQHVAPLLLGLSVALPQGMEIGRFDIGVDGVLAFEVYVPADRRIEESVSPPRLIALWQKEPMLAGRIESFKTENSERERVGGQNVLSWRFVAKLSGGG